MKTINFVFTCLILAALAAIVSAKQLSIKRDGQSFDFVVILNDNEEVPEFSEALDPEVCGSLVWKHTGAEHRARANAGHLKACVRSSATVGNTIVSSGLFGDSYFEVTFHPNNYVIMCSSQSENTGLWRDLKVTRQGAVATITVVTNSDTADFTGIHSRFGPLKFTKSPSGDYFKANVVLDSRPLFIDDDSVAIIMDALVACKGIQMVTDRKEKDSSLVPEASTRGEEPAMSKGNNEEATPEIPSISQISPPLTKNSPEATTMIISTSGCVTLLNKEQRMLTGSEQLVVRFDSVDLCYKINKHGECRSLLKTKSPAILRKATLTDPLSPEGKPFWSTKEDPFLPRDNEYDLCIINLPYQIEKLLKNYPPSDMEMDKHLKQSLSNLELIEMNNQGVEKELLERLEYQIQLVYYVITLEVDDNRLSGEEELTALVPIEKREGDGYILLTTSVNKRLDSAQRKMRSDNPDLLHHNDPDDEFVIRSGFPEWLTIVLVVAIVVGIFVLFTYMCIFSSNANDSTFLVSQPARGNRDNSSASSQSRGKPGRRAVNGGSS